MTAETLTGTPPTDLVLPRTAGSAAVAGRLGTLLFDRTVADRGAWALPVVAQAVVSALSFTVAGGVAWFLRTEGEMAALYQALAGIALVLLLIPLATLAGAAARLAATRRDTRLSSLRLLGATTGTVRLLTLLETSAMALVGAVVGVIGYAALMPVFGQLHFLGGPIGPSGLWLGFGPLALGVVALVGLTAISAAIGLRRVEISPLGVRTRAEAPRMHWLRVVLGGVAILGAIVVANTLQLISDDLGTIVAVMLVAFAVPMLAINLIGPWVLSVAARLDARLARTAVHLLAARSVLDDPKLVWRQIGGLALTSFIAVFLGVGMGVAVSDTSNPQEAMMMTDVRTGVLLTLTLAFITTACSVGITQAAAILDRRSLYVGLDMIGLPVGAMDAARRRAVLRPLLLVVAISAGCALLLVLPIAGATRTFDPTALLVVGAVLAGGILLVAGSLAVTRLTLGSVLATGLVRAE